MSEELTPSQELTAALLIADVHPPDTIMVQGDGGTWMSMPREQCSDEIIADYDCRIAEMKIIVNGTTEGTFMEDLPDKDESD